jgi:hypothetical protein
VKISGILPLRNAVSLGYPFDLAIRSMARLCDELVILVDPTSEDETVRRVESMAWPVALGVDSILIVPSPWNMSNHDGHHNCEISVQTAKALERATGDWVLSLQADEALHEDEIDTIRAAVEVADKNGITGIELQRLYFYGSLEQIRDDWTLWLLRLFKRGHWKPDVDGAMRFDPVSPNEKRGRLEAARLYHYSRIGDPKQIADRVRNLDCFFHAPDKVQAGELPPYDFDTLRKLDTYVVGHKTEIEEAAQLSDFPLSGHPTMAREYFGA